MLFLEICYEPLLVLQGMLINLGTNLEWVLFLCGKLGISFVDYFFDFAVLEMWHHLFYSFGVRRHGDEVILRVLEVVARIEST